MKQMTLDGKFFGLISEKPKESTLPILRRLEEALPLLEQGYTEKRIPKRGGGHRIIFVPSPELKTLQKKTILPLLQELQEERWCDIFGLYKHNPSYFGHAWRHKESRFIFSLDLKDAFPSVTASNLRAILLKAIVEKTIIVLNSTIDKTKLRLTARRLVDLIVKLTTLEDKLPQGAPTSPFLFYIFLYSKIRDLHLELAQVFEKIHLYNWHMTCYVDNFVISTNRHIPDDVREQIQQVFEQFDLKINYKKTKLQDCRHGAVMITGLAIDGKGKVFIPQKVRERIRATIHNACFMPDDPTLDGKIEGLMSYVRSIYGSAIPKRIQKTYKLYKEYSNLKKLVPPEPQYPSDINFDGFLFFNPKVEDVRRP